MIGDLIHYLNPLKNINFIFVKNQVPLVIRIIFNGVFVHGPSLELGLKVYDQSQAHGHLKGQNLLFGCIQGIS
jgi:hypothetical protein